MTAARKAHRKAHRKAAEQWAALPASVQGDVIRDLAMMSRDYDAHCADREHAAWAKRQARAALLAARVLREAAKGTR